MRWLIDALRRAWRSRREEDIWEDSENYYVSRYRTAFAEIAGSLSSDQEAVTARFDPAHACVVIASGTRVIATVSMRGESGVVDQTVVRTSLSDADPRRSVFTAHLPSVVRFEKL